MKKIIYLFAAAALALCLSSCNKENQPSAVTEGQPVKCDFTLPGFDSSMTKSTGLESDADGTAAEKAISSLQIFVFGSDNLLVASGSAANSNSLSLTVNSGTGYSIYAVANTEDFTSTVASVSDLESKVTDVLNTDNGASAFAMKGSLSGQTVSSESRSFSIEVERRAAKVVLRKVTNSLPVATGAISIEGVYLANVVTTSNMFVATLPTGANWVNQKGVYASLSTRAWFGDKLATAASVANGSAYETAHTFYASANPTAVDSNDETFGARFTRLVIKTKIQGVDYYYPISFNNDLPALTANSYIDITNVNIKHLGSTDPDTPVSTDEITVTVTVKDWVKTDRTVEI